jgi:hypothetical protein
MNQFDSQIRECMELLSRCHTMCLSMAMTHCLETGGRHARPQHLRLMMDCAAFCTLTGDMLAHKSQFHNAVCGLCADICETCAKDCETLDGMEDCVTACRQAAASCRVAAKRDHADILSQASRQPPN